MIDLTGVEHHPILSDWVSVLCNKTQNTDRSFFNAEVAYFFCKVASCQRASVVTLDRGEIPINMYALNLATSGYGKNFSVNIVEQEFLKGFQERFMSETIPVISEKTQWDLANKRALRNATDPQEEFDSLHAEALRFGAIPFTFDSGTTPAVKQLRHRLLLAGAGAINLQIDEVGSNLLGNAEVMTTFLELYDQGITKQKLTKNTSENTRAEELSGKTPANLLLFGTPSKLFDGGVVQNEFMSMWESGYARRCICGYGETERKSIHNKTVEEIFEDLIKSDNKTSVTKWANYFEDLADPAYHGVKITCPREVSLLLLRYKIECEKKADEMGEHEEIRKAEMSHRYFKALKLAGAYAFVDRKDQMSLNHIKQAILLVEESGVAFNKIMNRPKNYEMLATYLAELKGEEVTHADLIERLPFYKSGVAARNELMGLATSWGIKQHIIIQKSYIDNVEFFKAKTLEKTNLDEMIVSYSDHFAYGYIQERISFKDNLPALLTAEDPENPTKPMHWCSRGFKGEHRADENALPKSNLIVLDVDGGTTIEQVQSLMADYTYVICTTKRHTPENHRFRLVLPSSYVLDLDKEDYEAFMNNVTDWLPFDVDGASTEYSKKWETNPSGKVFVNEGKVLDALPFIPKTARNEQFAKERAEIGSMDSLEAWFATNIAEGERNKKLLRFALALVDNGLEFNDVRNRVNDFNSRLKNGLSQAEIDGSIMVTVSKRYE